MYQKQSTSRLALGGPLPPLPWPVPSSGLNLRVTHEGALGSALFICAPSHPRPLRFPLCTVPSQAPGPFCASWLHACGLGPGVKPLCLPTVPSVTAASWCLPRGPREQSLGVIPPTPACRKRRRDFGSFGPVVAGLKVGWCRPWPHWGPLGEVWEGLASVSVPAQRPACPEDASEPFV